MKQCRVRTNPFPFSLPSPFSLFWNKSTLHEYFYVFSWSGLSVNQSVKSQAIFSEDQWDLGWMMTFLYNFFSIFPWSINEILICYTIKKGLVVKTEPRSGNTEHSSLSEQVYIWLPSILVYVFILILGYFFSVLPEWHVSYN